MNGGNEFHGHHGPDHVAPMNPRGPQPETESTDDKIERIGRQDFEDVRTLLDKVLGGFPIYAVRIGYRHTSTDAERRLADWMFKVSGEWDEIKAEVYGDGDPR